MSFPKKFVTKFFVSPFHCNANLATIFEVNWPSTGLQTQSLSTVFVGAVETIFVGKYRDLMIRK